jgi:glycosyltransferase involved in cell wall biosynthesis
MELCLADDTLLVVAVGRMVPQKRPLLFLEKAQQILTQIPEAKFIWVGDGWLGDDWDRRVSEANLSHAISRVPWQKEVRPFLAAADLFLHAANFEGLPLALLEAMSAGLPCALTDNLLKEMPFLGPANSLSVNTGLEWIGALSDRAELKRIGEASRELLIREFSFSKMADRYEALYCSLARQRAFRRPPKKGPGSAI